MLSSVLTDNGVACRACGAARAPRDDEAQFGACKTCWDSFQRHRDRKLPLPDAFTEWLARRLVLDVRRHNRFGVAGRCEAVSDWLYGGHGSYQCGLPAIQINGDGRKVCGIHAKASRPAYVEQDDRRYYDMITYLLTTIGLADAPFREAVLKAVRLWPDARCDAESRQPERQPGVSAENDAADDGGKSKIERDGRTQRA